MNSEKLECYDNYVGQQVLRSCDDDNSFGTPLLKPILTFTTFHIHEISLQYIVIYSCGKELIDNLLPL